MHILICKFRVWITFWFQICLRFKYFLFHFNPDVLVQVLTGGSPKTASLTNSPISSDSSVSYVILFFSTLCHSLQYFLFQNLHLFLCRLDFIFSILTFTCTFDWAWILFTNSLNFLKFYLQHLLNFIFRLLLDQIYLNFFTCFLHSDMHISWCHLHMLWSH